MELHSCSNRPEREGQVKDEKRTQKEVSRKWSDYWSFGFTNEIDSGALTTVTTTSANTVNSQLRYERMIESTNR